MFRTLSVAMIVIGMFNFCSQHQSTTPVNVIDSLYPGVTVIGDFTKCIENHREFSMPSIFPEDIEGVVEVFVTINEEGSIENIYINNSLSPRIDSLVVEKIHSAKFVLPGTINTWMSSYVAWLFIPVYPHQINEDEYQSFYSREPGVHPLYDSRPSPVGGYQALLNAITYPKEAREKHIEARVIISFFIDSNGELGGFKILKPAGYGFEEAAINAIRSTKWTTSTMRNKATYLEISVPIVFKLDQKS